jgi:hypothetical protein
MDYYDSAPVDDFEENNKDVLYDIKKMDRGHTKIWSHANGSLKRSKIDVYTSGFIGSRIRNAETGEYFKHLVGSLDENLYFKVALTSDECKTKNGSNMLFYISPDHCMRHLYCEITDENVEKWEVKRKNRLLANKIY